MTTRLHWSASASLPLHPYITRGSTAQGPSTNLHTNRSFFFYVCDLFSLVFQLLRSSVYLNPCRVLRESKSTCTVLLCAVIDYWYSPDSEYQSCDSFWSLSSSIYSVLLPSSLLERGDGGEKRKGLVGKGCSTRWCLNPSSRWRFSVCGVRRKVSLLDIAFHSSCWNWKWCLRHNKTVSTWTHRHARNSLFTV